MFVASIVSETEFTCSSLTSDYPTLDWFCRKDMKVPWAAITAQPEDFFEEGEFPDNFTWKDPSHIKGKEATALVQFWYDRQEKQIPGLSFKAFKTSNEMHERPVSDSEEDIELDISPRPRSKSRGQSTKAPARQKPVAKSRTPSSDSSDSSEEDTIPRPKPRVRKRLSPPESPPEPEKEMREDEVNPDGDDSGSDNNQDDRQYGIDDAHNIDDMYAEVEPPETPLQSPASDIPTHSASGHPSTKPITADAGLTSAAVHTLAFETLGKTITAAAAWVPIHASLSPPPQLLGKPSGKLKASSGNPPLSAKPGLSGKPSGSVKASTSRRSPFKPGPSVKPPMTSLPPSPQPPFMSSDNLTPIQQNQHDILFNIVEDEAFRACVEVWKKSLAFPVSVYC